MPLLLNKKIDEESAYAVWNIQETFLELPYLSPEPFPADLNPVRQAEWIVGRILVKSLCNTFGIIYEGVSKEEKGKPFLTNSHANISITHSFPMAAAMLHTKKPCGIDIERPREQHQAVQSKFLHPLEIQYKNDLEKLCIVWCSKEVIYKIHGRRYLSFNKEINVHIDSASSRIDGTVNKEGYEDQHQLHYEWVKDYILAFGI